MEERLADINKNVEELQEIAKMFYQGNSNQGFEKMEEATSKILTMVDGLVQLSTMDSTKVKLDMNFINAALTEILNCCEKKDGILIADLLTFELLDYINVWTEQWKEQ